MNLKCDRPFLDSSQYEPLREALLNLKVQQGAATESCHENVRRLYDLATKAQSSNASSQALFQIDFQLTLGTLLFQLLQTIAANNASLTGSHKTVHPAIDDVITFMHRRIGENLSIADFAQAAGYSVSAFQALFKKDTGIAPKEYFLRMKLDWAKNLLAQPQKNITQISHELGFSSSQYFCTSFKRYHLLTPGDYRLKTRGR
ncbi:MAG: helix-turn-helix transcriptional regulator [Phycisphaeraceae bacterium]|nr:helix-turn-helix transcriptional regulator [Phycisphaeraceae bacterium]